MAHKTPSSQPLHPRYAIPFVLSTPTLNGFLLKNSSDTSTCHRGSSLADTELLNAIREIVPPPPLEVSSSRFSGLKSSAAPGIPFFESASEQLYTRRPSEKSLLEKCRNQLFSVFETERNLEELLGNILQEKKYSNENNITHLIFCVMQKWPMEILIQRRAFECLACLNSQNDEFCLPSKGVQNIILTMKTNRYCLDESIQRSGVKLLRNPRIMEEVGDNFEIVCILLNALCKIPGVDDFMSFTQRLVKLLSAHEKRKIRDYKLYVDMLVEFPFRLNERITVPLCWAALDVVLVLAECGTNWEVLIQVGGAVKLQKLSQRTEMKDRCDAILKIVAPAKNLQDDVICLHPQACSNIQGVSSTATHVNGTLQPTNPQPKQVVKRKPLTNSATLNLSSSGSSPTTVQNKINDKKAINKAHSAVYAWMLPSDQTLNSNNKTLRRTSQASTPQHCVPLDDFLMKEDSQFLPIDAVLTRNAPTPPPTQADVSGDIDGQFSDEEQHSVELLTPKSPVYAPLLSTPLSLSPSYSPPPTFTPNFFNERKSQAPSSQINEQSVVLDLCKGQKNGEARSSFRSSGFANTVCKESSRGKKRAFSQRKRKSQSGTHQAKRWSCLFCKESKGKQALLMKQLKQLYQNLLQPDCVDLLNCLNSNLCKWHSIQHPIQNY